LLSSVAVAQQQDSTLRFYGNLYDSTSYKPVKYAHIINLDGNNATISDSLGTFDIKIHPGDSLMITSIGYETTYYRYTGEWQKAVFASIPMKEKVYPITGVEVTPWGTYREFKRKFLELDIKDPEEDVHPLLWEGITREPKIKEPINPGISSPVTMIYNLFSEKAQSKQKLRELKKRKSREELIEDKYNREQISALTGLTGQKLERFMDYCDFSDEYILNTKEYFILERVKECYQHFMRVDSLHRMRIDSRGPG